MDILLIQLKLWGSTVALYAITVLSDVKSVVYQIEGSVPLMIATFSFGLAAIITVMKARAKEHENTKKGDSGL
jgi:hypothetical protein